MTSAHRLSAKKWPDLRPEAARESHHNPTTGRRIIPKSLTICALISEKKRKTVLQEKMAVVMVSIIQRHEFSCTIVCIQHAPPASSLNVCLR